MCAAAAKPFKSWAYFYLLSSKTKLHNITPQDTVTDVLRYLTAEIILSHPSLHRGNYKSVISPLF